MQTTWKVELHSHTLYSKDSLTTLEKVIESCQRLKIDKIAITDHNSAEGALRLAQMAPDLIIVGEEIMTPLGEILAFFVKETIPAGLSPAETIKRLRDQKAVISVSHPYDRLRKGAWEEADLLKIIDQVDALEVFNARCIFPEDNVKAMKLAQQYHKLMTVGSDAHIPYEYGHALLEMTPFESAGDFYESLKTAKQIAHSSPPWVHLGSSYAKYMRKLGLRKLPVGGGSE
jgi:predicted metal-dependent phosphoesterase TrpH